MFRRIWEHKVTHFILVISVFTITGSSVGKISAYLSSLIGLAKFSVEWWVFLLIAMLPIYQVLLLVVAFLLGKFDYFKAKQLKLWKRIRGFFMSKKDSETASGDQDSAKGSL